jgi:DNA-binding beta-propeller fold protein YncE
MKHATVVFLSLAGVSLLAQDPDSDLLRSLTRPVQQLPVDRVELKTSPLVTFEGISAVTADKQGNLYVIHRPADGNPVVVLAPQGKILRSWGKGMFKIPHSIRIDAAGNVWTVDANTSMVYKFTPTGRKILQISVGDVPGSTQEFCGATDVAFGPNGRVFVSDGYCNARVIEYDAAGKKIRQWGRPGTGPGEFNVVHAIAIGPRGNLYVADRENGRLQWFSLDGKFLGQWKFGGQLYNVAFSEAGELYVSTHPKGVSLDSEFDVVKLDPASGRMLGRIQVRAHELAVGPGGTLLPATRSGALLLFRPRK